MNGVQHATSTINVPQKVGEPLQRVTITQREEETRFKLKDSRAFVGKQRKRRAMDTGKGNSGSREKLLPVIKFDRCDPGQTFTIGLRPVEN